MPPPTSRSPASRYWSNRWGPPANVVGTTANALGIGTVALSIPNDAGLVGLGVHAQTGGLDAGAAGGFAATRGLLLTVQQ